MIQVTSCKRAVKLNSSTVTIFKTVVVAAALSYERTWLIFSEKTACYSNRNHLKFGHAKLSFLGFHVHLTGACRAKNTNGMPK